MLTISFKMTLRIPWKLICVIVFACTVAKWLYWQLTVGANRRRLIRENGCLPPRKYPHKGILGHLLGLDLLRENLKNGAEGQFHSRARERNFKHGNTLELRILWLKVITTVEPDIIKTMLSTKFNDWSLGDARKKYISPALGDGIFTNNGVEWERSRALIRPNFTRSQVADLRLFEHHIQNLLGRIPTDGSTFDLQSLFFKLSMDSSTQFLFGRSTNTLAKGVNDTDATMFAEAFTRETEAIAQDFRTLGLNRWFSAKRRREDRMTISKFADKIIEDALTDRREKLDQYDLEKQQYTFLFELLKLTQDPHTIRSELLNVLLAGRDTTASLLSHTFFELARRPNVWKKLQDSITELHGEAPDYETLKSMKYVKYVINESLRCYPVVPSNARTAIQDTVLPRGGGPNGDAPLLIRKGTIVSYSSWSLHRRTDYYGEDSLEFRPERWESLRPAYEYIPFNAGARICIGQNFALTEASYTIVRLLQHFKRIEARDDRAWSEQCTLTLAVGCGVNVALFTE